jgi:hypothetical protein
VDHLRIIGVCGRKRHGKDSVGRILRDHYDYNLTAFADAVKRVAMDVYGLTWEQCYGEETQKETPVERWGLSPRTIMQRIGTEVGRSIHPETWIRNTLDNIQKASLGAGFIQRDDFQQEFLQSHPGDPKPRWVITDVRFPNEAQAIRDSGGIILKVVRPSLVRPLDEHPSETSLDLILADYIIVNSGSLEDLANSVKDIFSPRQLDLFDRDFPFRRTS